MYIVFLKYPAYNITISCKQTKGFVCCLVLWAILFFSHTGGGRTFSELILFVKKLIPPGKFFKKSIFPLEILLFFNRCHWKIMWKNFFSHFGNFSFVLMKTLGNLKSVPPPPPGEVRPPFPCMVKKWNSPVYALKKNLF